jgi:hypothetical protein
LDAEPTVMTPSPVSKAPIGVTRGASPNPSSAQDSSTTTIVPARAAALTIAARVASSISLPVGFW